MGHLYYTLAHKAWGTSQEKREQKYCEEQDMGRTPSNTAFETWWSGCIQELTSATLVAERVTKNQGSQRFSVARAKSSRGVTPAEEWWP